MWEVPKENGRGSSRGRRRARAAATQLGSDYNEVFHSAPADMRMNPKQSHMMEMAKPPVDHGGRHDGVADGADRRIRADQDAGPNIGGPATSKEAARVSVSLSDKTVPHDRAHERRYPQRHVQSGSAGLEGTDALRRHYVVARRQECRHGSSTQAASIRSGTMGGEMHAVVEMPRTRCRKSMPRCGAPCANDRMCAMSAEEEGDASIMRPVTKGCAAEKPTGDQGRRSNRRPRNQDKAGASEGREAGRTTSSST